MVVAEPAPSAGGPCGAGTVFGSEPSAYSLRSTTMGSTLIARRAGR